METMGVVAGVASAFAGDVVVSLMRAAPPRGG